MSEVAMIDESRSEPVACLAALGIDLLPTEPAGKRKGHKEAGAELLRKLHCDPDFAAARDQRGRDRFKARREEMQRLSNAARRGYDVPPALEDQWKALKRKRTLSNAEIARMLGLKKWRKPNDRKGKKGL